MKKKLLPIILAIAFLLTPLQTFAGGVDVKSQFAKGSYAFSDSLYEAGELSEEARLTRRYAPKEQAKAKDAPTIGCKAAYLADPVSGKVFFEKNAHKKMYPASTTKILTALVVLEHCNTEDIVTVSEAAAALVDEGYSNANLQAGEKLSVFTLLQAMLIPSANEAAYALAEHVSGSVKNFAALCNQRAKELGCETLHFVNPNGLHNKSHYCSAYDLFLVARECQKYDVFNEIVKTKTFTIPATDIYPQNDRTYDNTNELLFDGEYYYSYCTGIKTGHTTPAGECLVASSFRDDLNLISVVLGGKITDEENERFSDTKKLFEYVNEHYEFKLIVDKTHALGTVNVKHAVSEQEVLDYVIQTDIYSVAPNEITPNSVDTQIKLAEEIKAPIKQNQVLGTVTYKVDGLIYSANIVAANDVQKKPFWLYNTLVALGIIALLIIIRTVQLNKQKKARQKARRERLAARQNGEYL